MYLEVEKIVYRSQAQQLYVTEYVGYMLTRSEFVAWLIERRSAGHSLTAIARDLGVSRQAVQQWLSGATQPSRTALMLAEHLYRLPLELPPGLPVAADRERPS
jgi:transcriptional regulator with XRE-family HTH domain